MKIKVIKVRLSQDSIQGAREELNNFADMIKAKLPEFVEELAEIGVKVIEANVQNALGADNKDVDIKTDLQQGNDRATMTIRVSGTDILFIEYGAGIRFNNGNVHPWAYLHGYGVGTYPNQTHAFNPNGWFYRKGGALHRSYGTMATMPVYKAYMTMADKVSEVAKRVFV